MIRNLKPRETLFVMTLSLLVSVSTAAGQTVNKPVTVTAFAPNLHVVIDTVNDVLRLSTGRDLALIRAGNVRLGIWAYAIVPKGGMEWESKERVRDPLLIRIVSFDPALLTGEPSLAVWPSPFARFRDSAASIPSVSDTAGWWAIEQFGFLADTVEGADAPMYEWLGTLPETAIPDLVAARVLRLAVGNTVVAVPTENLIALRDIALLTYAPRGLLGQLSWREPPAAFPRLPKNRHGDRSLLYGVGIVFLAWLLYHVLKNRG